MTLSLEKPGRHETSLNAHFGELSFPEDQRPLDEPVCIMAFMNRSGSSLMCEYMRATGRFSGFGEPLNHDLVISRAKEHGIATFPDYLRWLMQEVRREGTLFGLKASVAQIMMLLRAGVVPNYFNNVRWVMVQRRDILSQAISFSIAQQTQQWHSFENSNGLEPQYDFQGIRESIGSISEAYALMLSLFASLGIEPLHLVYEDFVLAPTEQTELFANYMGVEGVSVAPERLRMEKQRSDMTERFKDQFLNDFEKNIRTGLYPEPIGLA